MAKVFCVANQKGGVGKSTNATHLAFAAAEAGSSVLVGDMDTQGNSSQILTKDMAIRKRPGGVEQIFGNNKLKLTYTEYKNIDLLHGHGELEALDKRGERLLERAVEITEKVRTLPYDYVIFDTPPALGVRHVAPLFWADVVIVPVEPSIQSIGGMDETLMLIDMIKNHNPRLKARIVINKINRQSAHQRELIEGMKAKFGNIIIGEFSNRSAVAEAQDRFTPIWKFTKDSGLRKEWKSFAQRALSI